MWQPKRGRVCIHKVTGALGLIKGRYHFPIQPIASWYVQMDNSEDDFVFYECEFVVIGWLG